MQIKVSSGNILKEKTELLVLPFYEKEKELNEDIELLDNKLDGIISYALKNKDFEGELGTTLILYPGERIPAKRIVLLGVGKKKESDLDNIREAFGTAALKSKEMKIKKLTIFKCLEENKKYSHSEISAAIVDSILMAYYSFEHLKTGKKKNKIEVKEIKVLEDRRSNVREVLAGASYGKIRAEAANYTRELQSEPANRATPSYLEEEAKKIAEENKLKCSILDEKELKKLGLNLFLSVAKGSKEPSKLIILEYRISDKAKTIALVGKGITFDSGGISIKPSQNMEKMKYDMSGGGAVLGIMKAIGKIKPEVNVIGAVPATENLPGGSATKPGDIIYSYSGKTVEIINTDAEGRLVLADSLSYVIKQYKPSAIIDVATLTGACVVALGHHASGLMGNNTHLIKKIKEAAEKTGEKVWELPLWDAYSKQLKSDFADLKNIGNRYGGAITAGAFLKEFVGKTPWAHLDIAGTAYDTEKKPYLVKGPTGVGTRLILELLKNWE